MKYRMFSAVSAAALSLSLLAGASFAQDANGLGLLQLQDSAKTGMSQLGMPLDMVDQLTLDELNQIQAVTTGADADRIKTARIDTILRGAEDRIAAGGAVVPQSTAGDVTVEDLDSMMVVKEAAIQHLAQLGVVADVDTMTDEQLMQIQLIGAGGESEANKKRAVEAIIAQ